MYGCVCVFANILLYLFAPKPLFRQRVDHFLTKDGHFSFAPLSLLLYIRFALSFLCLCVCVCFCLPAASVTYLNFTRAYTGKDKRDLYPLMPVICSIKLLYAAPPCCPFSRFSFSPLRRFPFVIAFSLSFLLPLPQKFTERT